MNLLGCSNQTWMVRLDGRDFQGRDIQDGLTFVRHCGWFSRAWTFQEICLARHAVLQAGSQQIDWITLATGWQPALLVRFDDWRNALREINFVERVRHESSDLLLLLRSIWNRDATDKRDKAYAILGMYQGMPSLEPDYRLSVRQALVSVSLRVVEETKSLDILHFAGMEHCPTPLWGLMKMKFRSEPWDALNDEQDFTGGWHLPSWTRDWGSKGNNTFPMRDISSLRKLEFPEVNHRFRLDVRSNGEHLVTAGIALGRLLQFENPEAALDPKVMVVPFPICVVSSYLGDRRF